MRKPRIGITCHNLANSPVQSSVVQEYVETILAAGGAPLAIPFGLDDDSLTSVYSVLDGLLLPGGADVAPERYGQVRHPKLGSVDEPSDQLELRITQWALRDDLPILAICRGIQVLAVAGGGTLYQDLPSQWGRHVLPGKDKQHLVEAIAIEADSHLARAIGTASSWVNSLHHQAVREVPSGFGVTARSEDGIVEAIEATDRSFVVGVQCHPEGMWRTAAPEYAGLFAAFVQAARERAAPATTI